MDISRAELEPVVVKFYRQYMQQINDVTYPSGSLLVNPDVQDCIYRYFFDSSRNKYLPPPKYQARILKHIISDIEKACKNPEEDQVSDLLMEHMGILSAIPQQQPFEDAQQAQVHSYFPPLPLDQVGVRPILIKEAQNLLSRGNNVGLRTWEAAQHLAWYLMMERPDLVKKKNVLELGAGTGFLSLLCAGELDARHVLATDGLAHVCESLQTNADLNKANDTLHGHNPPQVQQLDWTDQSELEQVLRDARKDCIRYDLVIGADITYHPDILRPLAELLKTLSDVNPGLQILISSTIRNVHTFSQFTAICQEDLGFRITDVKCIIPEGLRYSGFFHSVATEIKIVRLKR
ncbi:uncharacterized protein A1O9_07283 [Exophiala aquamarina CBS 119918]|uniref:FAM86 N-terminal domain-containing protein n=1 Tax=Exophiala aquamarina CBS 119918 TaxID=1182545 RepID=A0A072PCS3_9EURO|nr:uncharacterized protein A1O9_07283 [Exophiala aquamarina CBS 119918]KEF57093.1 hypothetical protein A1O9_07283 [Exophiala aquamarina CBS 119918]